WKCDIGFEKGSHHSVDELRIDRGAKADRDALISIRDLEVIDCGFVRVGGGDCHCARISKPLMLPGADLDRSAVTSDVFERLGIRSVYAHQPAVMLSRERLEKRAPRLARDIANAHFRYFRNQSRARRATCSSAPGSSNR